MSCLLFQTERLSCRRWLRDDLDRIFAVYADEEGARWVGDGEPITLEESVRWLDVTFNNYATRGYGMSTIVEKASDEIVGFIGLVHPGGQTLAEVKYAFDKSRWGLGYASEIVPSMLNYGHKQHDLATIIATVAEENLASRRVLEKSGMRFVRQYEEDDQSVFLYEWSA